MTDNRCAWSDLPAGECHHCDRNPRPHLRDFPVPPENVAYTIASRPHVELPRTGRALPEDTAHYELIDHVAALCDWTKNAEPRDIVHHRNDGTMTTIVTRHLTTHPPLIAQLWEAAEGSRGLDTGNKAFGSQPSARLEALDVVATIDREAHHSLRHTHREANSHDRWPETIAAVRHLGSVATDADAKTIRRWWAMARVVTGWDLPAFRPDNTCPLCAKRGSLRIKYPTGFCVECREYWDHDTVGLLVEHIRSENGEDEAADEPADTTEAAC